MVACGAPSNLMNARLATPPDFLGSDSCMLSPTPSLVEQLKQDLLTAANNNDESSGISICNKLEKLNLNKDYLESTRIGGAVNEIRKRVAESMPKFSSACRSLIKQWRKQTETYTRSASSCGGGSNGVTPSMLISTMSPAMRRLVTPQTPHRLIDGSITKSQVSSPRVVPGNLTPASSINGAHDSSNDLVAQAVEKVELENGTDLAKLVIKRKVEASISPNEAQSAIKRSKSALIPQQPVVPHQSLSAFRQNAQSTTELLAQLSENLPSHLTPEISLPPKSHSISPPIEAKVNFALSNQDEKREKRKYTKRASRFFKDGSIPSTSAADQIDVPTVKPDKKQTKTATITTKDKKIDWFASIPSLDELRRRVEEKSKVAASADVRSSYVVKVNNHDLISFPFVDVGIPDVIEFNYPKDQSPKSELPYPRAFHGALKGIDL